MISFVTMSGQSGGHRVHLSELNEQLTCKLCEGYFIDATTIIECLHSFCRSCVVKYLENNKYCPICEVLVHKSRPLLNVRPDRTLQDIVYKLVPGCYQNEMRRRKEFYAKHPEVRNRLTSPEARGEPVESHIYSPDESLGLSLEYFNPYTTDLTSEIDAIRKPLLRRYLRCPAAVTVFHLQKLIRAKYGLSDAHRVDIMYKEELLLSSYTLMDVMYIYHWRRKVPLHLSYRIFESSLKRIKLSEDNASYEKLLTNADICSMETKDDESLTREWKEVQLKISETGVMSITDISNTILKRDTEIEILQDRNPLEEMEPIASIVNKTYVENCNISMRSTPVMTKNPIFTDDISLVATSDSMIENLPVENCTPLVDCRNKAEMNLNESENCIAPETKNQIDQLSLKEHEAVERSETKSDNIAQDSKKLSMNDNADRSNQMEKDIDEAGNAESIIDASKFQPKMSQINNTYSKKASKEKRAILRNKLEVKSSMEATYSEAAEASLQKSISMASRNVTLMDSGSQVFYEKDNRNVNIDVQRALNLLEQKTNLSARILTESTVLKTSQTNGTVDQKLHCAPSNDGTDTSNENISNTTSRVTSTSSPCTVHDLVVNAKPMSSNCVLEKSSLHSTSNDEISISRCNVSAASTNPYVISTSTKNNCSNASRNVSIVTSTLIATMATPKSTSTLTSTPCPDAIPISLMKPSMRKQEITAKGSNLNEICAKISSTGSKINDICAKIGESSKEKHKVVGKSEIPDLLKIANKSDVITRHAPNIPNVPVYTPSIDTTIESKSVKTVLPAPVPASSVSTLSISTSQGTQRMLSFKKQNQHIGYKTLRDPPKSWNPTLSKNNYVVVKNQTKEIQNQIQTSEGASKQISSKPAKIFKMRNMPRYLGNPASGVKPMYGVETKEKEQSTTTSVKNATLNMMKIDPKTLSPIVSTINSPIVSPPPYARNYQNTPFARDICRSTGSPISPRNSPVNMLSTNPFIPSPTPNTNPRLIYSHFPPFPDASRFPNPLIRSPIGIPPSSAFHSSLPPSINKLYQRSSYVPPQTGYSQIAGQPPTVQRIPPSTRHSSSPKSPKTSSPSSSSSFVDSGKVRDRQSSIASSVDNVALLLSKNVTTPSRQELDAFNLSQKLDDLTGAKFVETSPTNDVKVEAQNAKQNSSSSISPSSTTTSAEMSTENSTLNSVEQRKSNNGDASKNREIARGKEENGSHIYKSTEIRYDVVEITDATSSTDDNKKNQTTKVNGEITTEHYRTENKKTKEGDNDKTKTTEQDDDRLERRSSSTERNIPKNNDSASMNVNHDKISERIRSDESERNKAET